MPTRFRIAALLIVAAACLWVIASRGDDGEPAPVSTAAAPPPAGGEQRAGGDAGRAGRGVRAEDARETPPRGSAKGSTRPAYDLQTPPGAHALIWVRKGRRVAIHTEPGGGKRVGFAGRQTEFGSPTVFGVVRTRDGWAAITTPKLPNGKLGWVRLDPRRLAAGWTRLAIEIDLSDRVAALRRGDRVVHSFPVTVGAPGSETPTGRFAVTDTFRGDLHPAYGCCALALSANQPKVPSGWLGGTRIAIHGTDGALGVAASHGCVRAADRDVDTLVDTVPLGTPVFIHA